MLEYSIVTASDLFRFTRMVNTELKNGWSLQGGINVSKSGGGSYFYQAIIRTV